MTVARALGKCSAMLSAGLCVAVVAVVVLGSFGPDDLPIAYAPRWGWQKDAVQFGGLAVLMVFIVGALVWPPRRGKREGAKPADHIKTLGLALVALEGRIKVLEERLQRRNPKTGQFSKKAG